MVLAAPVDQITQLAGDLESLRTAVVSTRWAGQGITESVKIQDEQWGHRDDVIMKPESR
jgi:hypothetical protein